MSQSAPRPGQATFAAWLIIGGSVILVITAWQRISSLHTLEVTEELQKVLSEPPVSGTGLDLESLKAMIRVLCMIAAAAATASTILGVQALKGSTSARLALSLLAPLVLIGGFATAGFFAPLVVAGVVMLWLRPTRDWFAGRPWTAPSVDTVPRRPNPFAPPSRPDEGGVPGSRPEGPQEVEPTAQPASPMPPSSGQVAPEQPGPYAREYGAPVPPDPIPVGPDRRPGAVIAAGVITWVSSALVSGVMLLFSLIMAVAREDFFAELERQEADLNLQGMSHAELATGVFVMTGLILAWSLAASVLAILVVKRVAWARIALLVSTGTVGLALLAATFANPLLLVLFGAAGVSFWLLLRADVNAWFRR